MHPTAVTAFDLPPDLAERFAARTATVAIIGLGHVGLPLAIATAAAGFQVLGFDRDPARPARLSAGESHLAHIADAAVAAQVAAGRLSGAADAHRLAEADAVLICVPTPLDAGGAPDLGAVEDTARSIAAQLRPRQLVVLESTTWPGTTRHIVQPILESSGLCCGSDFFLAYSPEREDPGNPRFATAGIPKVVAGADPAAAALAAALYGAIFDRIVPVASLEIAEAVKLMENVFRAVNIGLVNELKAVFGAMGIDVWQVIAAAATKPFGFMPFWPGPGPGGHCIPVDPQYLVWKARQAGVPARFAELAAEVNGAMPGGVVARLAAALAERGRGLAGARILILGLGYKPGLADLRESPGLRLWGLLAEAGAAVAYYDPLVEWVPPDAAPAAARSQACWPWSAPRLAGFDAALIATDHPGVDYAALVRHAPLVVDTRNVCARLGLAAPHVVPA